MWPGAGVAEGSVGAGVAVGSVTCAGSVVARGSGRRVSVAFPIAEGSKLDKASVLTAMAVVAVPSTPTIERAVMS